MTPSNSVRRLAADAIRNRAAEYERDVSIRSLRRRGKTTARAMLKIAAELRALADKVEFDG